MSASADRNLLFGILAVQLDFVTKDALVAAMNAWLLDKSKPLGDLLRDQGHLTPERLQLLTALVAEHVKQYGGDPQRSLAALSSVPPTLKQQLAALPDEAVQQSIAQVGAVQLLEPDADPNQTVAQPLPPPSAVRYRILRPHARGGLGEVFVAEDTELGRSVALKEIQNRYADDRVSRERFVREAEITGGLEHPGIVPVYGLGTYDNGRPFYAMRFIKGDNLKAAIKQFHEPRPQRSGPSPTPLTGVRGSFDSFDFRQLLRRFVDVCNAVAYAHSRGVLHRDLKPGNVMLGKFGETLVVDWGLAKPLGRSDGSATDPDADATLMPRSGGDSSAATVAGQAMGTPAYMSPEQAAGRWDELGPTTDIYSLGATLYELLAGKVPFPEFDLDAVQKGAFLPPRAVQVTVPRALEAICLTAMALKPVDRYASALDLAKEVERWLADEPVAAYRERAGAQLRRWVRKHARLATGVGVALAVGMAALGGLAWQRELAREAIATKEGEAVKERDRAVAARGRTREALDAMVSTVTGASLATQKDISPEQKAFLQSVLKYYEEFAAEPGEDREARDRLARAHFRLGMIHDRLGQREEGAAVFARTVDLYARLAADFPGVANYLSGLAGSHHNLGNLLGGLGRRAEAEAQFRAALAGREKLAADFPAVPDYRGGQADSHTNLGALLRGLGRRADAEAEYRAALVIQQKLAADFPAVPWYRSELARTYNNLGNLLDDLGRRADAEAQYRAALATQEKLAADFPAVPGYRGGLANSHTNLGDLLRVLGKRIEAEAEFRAALAIQRKLAADFPAVPDYRSELANSHNNLGNLLDDLGRRAEAEAECRTALAIQEKLAADFAAVPDYRGELARTHHNLGNLLDGLGRRTEAEAEYRAAVASRAKLAADFPAVPDYRRDLANSHNNWGILLYRLGRWAEAESAYRAALAGRAKLAVDFPAVPDYRGGLADSHTNLGALLRGLGRRADAEAEYRAALVIQQKLAADFPAVPWYRNDLANSHNNLGNLLDDLGRPAEAEAEFRAALAIQEKLAANLPAVPDYRGDLARIHHNLGNLLDGLGRQAEAEAEFRAALAGRERLAAGFPAVPGYSQAVARTQTSLADLLARTGRCAEAAALAEKMAAEASVTAISLYDCACVFGVAAAAPDNADADRHAGRAVELLRESSSKGYRNILHLLADPDLAPLRNRSDYAALLWDLADIPAKEPTP